MKNTLLIILIFVFNGIYAQGNGCNFTMEIQGSIVKDSTYSLKSVSFDGIKASHQRKIISLMNFDYEQKITLNVAFFEAYLAAVCQYKKYTLSKVMIGGNGDSGQLLLVYIK
ncbi:MAG: hypothetical protein GQ574_22495 [Crocinitomix sp.]|nr:hypothetical protein [Crocinitomix sp.]